MEARNPPIESFLNLQDSSSIKYSAETIQILFQSADRSASKDVTGFAVGSSNPESGALDASSSMLLASPSVAKAIRCASLTVAGQSISVVADDLDEMPSLHRWSM